MTKPPEIVSPNELGYLIAFERAFSNSARPSLGEWIAWWPYSDSRNAIACTLIESAAERTDYELGWLYEQLRDPRVPAVVWQSGDLLQTVFADQLGKGWRPCWDDYAVFGIPPTKLKLRTDKDRCYLGQEISGHYHLVRRLGDGGLGVVYEARDSATGRSVAVKVPLEAEVHEHYDLALRKEASLLESLEFPGVPGFIELVETSEGPLLVTELIVGKPLETSEGFAVEEALAIAERVATILDCLHQQGHVHGDVKPDNLLVGPDGKLTLIDFNISRSDNPLRTTDGFPGGTLPFMSPEAMLGVGADVDLRQDIYSLGSLLFELLLGRGLVAPADKEEALVMSILVGGVHELEFPEHIPETVQQMCRAAIARQPLSRFETAGDFAACCRAVLNTPTDAISVPPLRSEILAWRLGVALGALAVRQRRITTELADTPNPTVALLLELASYIAGVTAAHDEAVPLAERLGISLSAWPGADGYQQITYHLRKPSQSDVDDLKRLAVEAETWCRDALEVCQTTLIDSAPESAALYFAAVQSRFAAYSSAAAEKWPFVAASAALPAAVCEQFNSACKLYDPKTDWGKELKGLDYAVIRWLRWGKD